MSAPYILLLTRALDTGGAQRQLVELALGLKRAGWKVAVATFYGGGALEAPLTRADVPIFCLEKRGRWDVIGFLSRLIALLRCERPDFAKSSLVMSNVLLAAVKPFVRPTRVVWGVAASDMDLEYYDRLARIEFRLSIALSRFADLIIANSEAGRRYHIARGYPESRITVIPNGIDVEHFRYDEDARRAMRAEWNIADGVVLVGVIGRIDPIKDHSTFLRAAARVAAVRPQTRFVCVGPGSGAYAEQMAALSEKLGIAAHVTWAGERPDIARVYSALDLLVSSSLSEGLPNVVAEAMASGVPCVVTDAGDSAQVVGEFGRVCAPGDSEALAQAILDTLAARSCDRRAMRARICTRYSQNALVERTIEQLVRLDSERLASHAAPANR